MTFRDFWQSNISADKPAFRAVLFDVDGTVVSGGKPLPGADETLQWLRNENTPFLFLTNDSHHSPEEKSALIRRAGVSAMPQEIVACSHVLEWFVKENQLHGKKVFIMGELGEPCFAEAAGLIPSRDVKSIDECELIIAGEGYYDFLRSAEAALNYFLRRGGGKLVVPNPDDFWPNGTSGRLGIGAGAEARFLEDMLRKLNVEIEMIYLGKPYGLFFQYALERLHREYDLLDLQPNEVIMVGDSLKSDIAGGKLAGLTTAVVMSGLTTPEILAQAPAEQQPDMVWQSVGRNTPD